MSRREKPPSSCFPWTGNETEGVGRFRRDRERGTERETSLEIFWVFEYLGTMQRACCPRMLTRVLHWDPQILREHIEVILGKTAQPHMPLVLWTFLTRSFFIKESLASRWLDKIENKQVFFLCVVVGERKVNLLYHSSLYCQVINFLRIDRLTVSHFS